MEDLASQLKAQIDIEDRLRKLEERVATLEQTANLISQYVLSVEERVATLEQTTVKYDDKIKLDWLKQDSPEGLVFSDNTSGECIIEEYSGPNSAKPRILRMTEPDHYRIVKDLS